MVIQLSFLCTTFIFYLFGEQYIVSFLPKGSCFYCCPIHIYSDVKLYAYSQHIDRSGVELSWTDFESNVKIFNNTASNLFYIHGFTENSHSRVSTTIIDALLKSGCVVVVVDWKSLAAFPWYNEAIVNSEPVGILVANWLDSMCSSGLNLKTIHLIGFSLGAEIAGYIGYYLTSGTLPRITALDPAHGAKTDPRIGRRITTEDADLVDVIHTDSGPYGYLLPQGHVDFFPNMGTSPQPGCTFEEIVGSGRLWEFVACSHNRAWRYFIESIHSPYAFPAIAMGAMEEQNLIAYMGIAANESCRNRGMYYLDTSNVKPYGKGRQSIHIDPF